MLVWGAAANKNEALRCSPLVVGPFLTGHGQVQVHSPGFGDLWSRMFA